MLVRHWDDKVHHVATLLPAMPVYNRATAENLFEAPITVMKEHEIPRENVIGYASDTANVMFAHITRY